MNEFKDFASEYRRKMAEVHQVHRPNWKRHQRNDGPGWFWWMVCAAMVGGVIFLVVEWLCSSC